MADRSGGHGHATRQVGSRDPLRRAVVRGGARARGLLIAERCAAVAVRSRLDPAVVDARDTGAHHVGVPDRRAHPPPPRQR